MSKFKVGDKVFSLNAGVVTLQRSGLNNFPVDDGFSSYTEDGFFTSTCKFPSLFTLDEARKLWPERVPSEPLKVEIKVRWRKKNGYVFPVCYNDDFDWDSLVGKKGTLTFVEDTEEQTDECPF